MAKLPYMQFYTGDWMKDQAVRASSLAARGLWFDLLCFMWESPERGYLKTPAGMPMTPDHISRMVGEAPGRVKTLLDELRANGVFDEQDGCIVNRRMVRSERLSRTRSESAKKRWDPEVCSDDADGLHGGLHMQNGSKSLTRARSRSDFRNQTSESEAKAAALVVSNFPRFAAAARSIYPVDDVLLARIIAAAQAEYKPISDADLEDIVLRGVVRRDQKSPALWLKTIPEFIADRKRRMGIA